MKRRVSLVLVLAILLSILQFPVAAAEEQPVQMEQSEDRIATRSWSGTSASGFSGGKGTEAEPYYIANENELAYLANSVNSGNTYAGKYIELVADMDLSGGEWTPIGNTASAPFYGNFKGNGYTISGLQINTTSSTQPAGLFGVNYGTVSDLQLSIAGITKNYAGIQSQISNMETGDYSIGARAVAVGGVAGVNYGTIRFVNVTGPVTARYEITDTSGWRHIEIYLGGIAGVNESVISDCLYSGAVSGSYYYGTGGLCIGGLCGLAKNSALTNSRTSGSIQVADTSGMQTTYCAGGLVGSSKSDVIKQCGSDVSVNVSAQDDYLFVGGLVGKSNYTTIEAAYAAGQVSATVAGAGASTRQASGGLIGETVQTTINNCYTANSQVKMWASNDKATAAGKLVGLAYDYDNGRNTTATKATNCYVSGSTRIVRKIKEGSGCNTKYVESNSSNYGDWTTDGFTASANTLSAKLGWGTYTSLANTQSNPKNVWRFQNGRPYLYTELIYSLTIRYYNEANKLFDTYFAYYDPNANYYVASPTVSGSAASPEAVSGTISADTFANVYYQHQHMPGQEATCTSEQRCLLCDMVLAEKLPHAYTEQVVAPTCEQSGYRVFTCTNCPDTYSDSFVRPLGHQLNEQYVCTVCGVSFTAPLQQYAIYVLDYATEKAISGAEVKLGQKTIRTDADGVAVFQLEKLGAVPLEITAAGYPTYTVSEYLPAQVQYDCVYLESVNAVINGAWCNGDNVTTGKTQLNAQAHGLTAKIVISGSSKDKIDGYELVQGGVVIAKSEDGVFSVANPTFKIKQDVYVRMYTVGEDTRSVFQRKLNIEVVGFIFNFETDLKHLLPFSQGLKMSFPDGTPGFEGYELKIPNPLLDNTNVTYRHENDKILVMVGFEKDYAEDPALKDMDTGELFKKLIDDWASETKDDKEKEVHGSLALVVEFNDRGVTKAYGQINVGFHLGWDTGKTFMVGVVPIYGEIGLSLDGEFEVSDIGYDRLNAQLLIPQFETKLGGAITLYAGVGCHVASVGVYGKVAVELVFSSDQESAFEKGALTGELGVYAKVKLLFFKELCYRYPLLQGQITWPDHTKQLQKRLYSIDAYTTDAREYLVTRSAWYYATDSGADTHVLQESAYTAIEPKLVTCGDRVMMLFLDDDGSDGLNYQHLYYALYDETTGGWSIPRRVDTNARPDVEFDVYADGRDIYIAYTELESISQEAQDDYSRILGTAEVIAARYDIRTDQFTDHTSLSANATFDTLPKIGGTAEGVTVAWVNNLSGDLFSQNANNTVAVACLTEQGWTDAKAITQMGPTVVSMDVGVLDGTSYVATVCDVDCDLATLEDRVLRLTDMAGNTLQILNTDNANDGVQFVRMQGKEQLLWYNGGNLYCVSAAEEAPVAVLESTVEGLTGNYKFLRVDTERYAVLFTQNEQSLDDQGNMQNGSNVYGIFCQDGIWGEPVPITQNAAGAYVDAYDACMYDGKVIIPYTSAETVITEEDIVKHIDFLSATVELRNDLIAGQAVYRPGDLFRGDTVAISVPVTNQSWQKAQSIAYAVQDSAGNIVFEGTQAQQINSGATEDLVISLPKGVLTVGEAYSIHISTADWTDHNDSNNVASLALWYTDFSVNAAQMNLPGSKELRYTVTNDGNISGDAVLKVYKLAADGKTQIALTEDIAISDLGIGKTVSGSLPITEAYYETGTEEGAVFLTVEAQKAELYRFNDTVSVSIGGVERNATTQTEEAAAESPVVIQPYVAYDPVLDDGVSVAVDEKGWTFAGVQELPAEAYSYADGVLTVYKDSLETLCQGYHGYTLTYSMNGQTTEVLVLLEVIDSGYVEVALTAQDRVVKYDGGALELGKDILYSTQSRGQLSCEYSADDGATWKAGLPKEIGTYRVKLTVDRDDENRYLSASTTLTVTVEKGSRAISVPAVQGVFGLRMRFGNAHPTAGQTDGTILYGYSLTDDITTVAQWSPTGVLPADHKERTYYIFAKITGGANYEDAYSLGYAAAKPDFEAGDVDRDGKVDNNDVIALLWNTLFPEEYPVFVYADFTGNGLVDNEDVIALLWYTLFPEKNPLQ